MAVTDAAAVRERTDALQNAILGAMRGEPVDALCIHALTEILGSLMAQRVLERPESLPMYLDMLARTVGFVASAVVPADRVNC